MILLRTLMALFLYAQASSILRWWAIVSGKASSKLGALLWFLRLTFSNLLHMAGWGLRPRLGIWALSLLGVVLPLDVGPLFVFLPFPSRLVLFLDWTCFIFKNKNLIHSSFFQSFPSFCPGESQRNTESARLHCCTSFPNFPFLYSWRKTRENRISHTLLLHVHFLLEKDKGTEISRTLLLHSKWLFCGKTDIWEVPYMKNRVLKTVTCVFQQKILVKWFFF